MMPARYRPGAALATVAAVVFALVAVSALRTLFPLVLSDEAQYLLPTLHGYHAENFARWGIVAAIPSHLFHAIYGALPTPIYASAKLLNAAFVAVSAAPIYALARTRLPAGEAAILAALAIAAPVASYARYFMPECLYVFGFWLALYAFVRALRGSMVVAGLVAGVCFGMLSLVKPHALGGAVGIAMFLLLRPGGRRATLLGVLCLGAGYAVSRALLEIALTGRLDVSLEGPAYEGMLAGGPGTRLLVRNAIGHVAALTVLAAVPVWVVGRHLVRALARWTERVDDLALLAACVLGALVAMSAVFSASVHPLAPETERITRLHGRYYAYALPLLMIAFAALTGDGKLDFARPRGILLTGGAVVASLALLASAYETSVVDFPELSLLVRWPAGVLVGLLAAGAALFVARIARDQGRAIRAAALAWWGVPVS